jgi:exodeoxyribonuclease VII small subunit
MAPTTPGNAASFDHPQIVVHSFGMSDKQNEPDVKFEAALEQLETIVGKLEGGELDLEESMTLFEEGVKLAKACQKKLDAAEKRIEKLVKDRDGKPDTAPMDDPTDDSPF